jgi:hypothetical protein
MTKVQHMSGRHTSGTTAMAKRPGTALTGGVTGMSE